MKPYLTKDMATEARKTLGVDMRLPSMMDRPMTPLEFMTRRDGEWATYPYLTRIEDLIGMGFPTPGERRAMSDIVEAAIQCFLNQYGVPMGKDLDMPKALSELREAWSVARMREAEFIRLLEANP